MSSINEISGQTVCNPVILNISSFRRKTINATRRTNIDVALKVLADTASVIARQSIGNAVSSKDRVLGRHVIKPADTRPGRSNPQTSSLVYVQISNSA